MPGKENIILALVSVIIAIAGGTAINASNPRVRADSFTASDARAMEERVIALIDLQTQSLRFSISRHLDREHHIEHGNSAPDIDVF